MTTTWRRSLAVALLLALSGCGSGAASSEGGSRGVSPAAVKAAAREARRDGLLEQYEALEDGEVSKVEYEDAVERTVSCIRDFGYTATDPIVNPVDGLGLLFRQDPNGHAVAQFNQDAADCNDRHLSRVASLYMSTHPRRMDEAIRVRTVRCLRQRGVKPTGTEQDAAAFVDLVGFDDRDAAVSCIEQAAEAEWRLHGRGNGMIAVGY